MLLFTLVRCKRKKNININKCYDRSCVQKQEPIAFNTTKEANSHCANYHCDLLQFLVPFCMGTDWIVLNSYGGHRCGIPS